LSLDKLIVTVLQVEDEETGFQYLWFIQKLRLQEYSGILRNFRNSGILLHTTLTLIIRLTEQSKPGDTDKDN